MTLSGDYTTGHVGAPIPWFVFDFLWPAVLIFLCDMTVHLQQ